MKHVGRELMNEGLACEVYGWPKPEQPKQCPVCNRDAPLETAGAWPVADGDGSGTLDVVFRCLQPDCGRLFLGVFTYGTYEEADLYEESKVRTFGGTLPEGGITRKALRLTGVSLAPRNPPPTGFPPEVLTMSPSFEEIYREAALAESYGLMHVAGCGYRKSVEFLIRDYALSKAKSEQERNNARSAPLASVIREAIGDPSLKACAECAWWIGCDESHYERRYEDQDIDEMRKVIRATTAWIELEALTLRKQREMPKRAMSNKGERL